MSESGSALQFGSPEYHKAVRRRKHPPALFATAPEIFLTHRLADADEGAENNPEAKTELMEEKLDEADSRAGLDPDEEDYGKVRASQRNSGWYGGLSHRIRRSGYDWTKPLIIRNESEGLALVDGHHRLAVMMRDRPHEFLPLEHY